MKKFILNLVSVAAVLLPLNAYALVTTTGFFSGPAPSLFAGDIAQGNATADRFDDFAGLMGSIVAAERLNAFVTTTVNPFLTAGGGGGFANSISLDYQVNLGPLFNIPLTQTNMTASGMVPLLTLESGDVLKFFVHGVAGPSGNDVDFNISTSPVPVPPAIVLLLGGIAGLGILSRRAKRNGTGESQKA